MTGSRLSLGLLAAATVFASVSIAHDDPKTTAILPAYTGPGYRAAWRARTGVPLHQTQAGQQFPAVNVTLLSWVTLGEMASGLSSGNDCWGYVAPSGREYAIMGTSNGTAFVEVTNPADAQVVTHLSGSESLWRDVKTYDQYAYAVSEGGGGIQVFDLTNIDGGVVTLVNTITSGPSGSDSHNVAIDTTSGYLYRCGGTSSDGLRVYDLSNPAAPSYVGAWNDRYVHDVQVVTYPGGQQVAFAFGGFNGGWTNPGVDVLDVTQKDNIQVLSTVQYPNAVYSHQGWLSEDRRYLYVGDEVDEQQLGIDTATHVYDVQNLSQPQYMGVFDNGQSASSHNMYVRDDLLFQANYSSGLRVFDISQGGAQVTEVGYFDTAPGTSGDEFTSLWSTFVEFPSGIVIGSDLQQGLFVWWYGDAPLSFDYPNGVPELVDPNGQAVTVRIVEGTPGALLGASPKLHWDLDDGFGLQDSPLVPLGGDLWRADLPAAPCGATYSWYVSAQSATGVLWTDPAGTGAPAHQSTAAASLVVAADDDMETPTGWTVGAPGDDASTGIWTLGNPLGTTAQPEDDHSEVGTDCWFTGQGSPGGSLGENDVDGGVTTLLSPVYDLSQLGDPQLSYWRWYDNAKGGSPNADVFEVHISNDGGSGWALVESVGPSGSETSGGWYQTVLRVADFVAPTSQVQLSFRASDEGDGSIVEAAVDDVRITDLDCPPLSADEVAMSVATGGVVTYSVDAGPSHAGELYLLLGSLTGTAPGIPAGSFELPLVWDFYTTHTLSAPNLPPLTASFGTLGGLGDATTLFSLTPFAVPSLVGNTAHHAFAAIDPGGAGVTLASNPVPLQFLP